MHRDLSPLAGMDVKIRAEANEIGGATLRVEDWWDRASGVSWTMADGNPAALRYAMRTGLGALTLPLDDEVLYGKIGGLGYLVHMREIELPADHPTPSPSGASGAADTALSAEGAPAPAAGAPAQDPDAPPYASPYTYRAEARGQVT